MIERRTLMSQREMKMKRIGIPRRREGAIAGSGVSDTPAPNMSQKSDMIPNITRK